MVAGEIPAQLARVHETDAPGGPALPEEVVIKKIPTLFERDFEHDPRFVTRRVTPGCFWVQDTDLPNQEGMAVATRKYDGSCVMFDGQRWWSRREVKPGKPAPVGFVQVADSDEVTGKRVGWCPIEFGSFAKQSAAVIERGPGTGGDWEPGTYELCGPSVNRNPEQFEEDVLAPHGRWVLDVPDRSYDGLVAYLRTVDYEGIVFWFQRDNPEGGMVKIKRRDFRELA